MIDNSYLTFVLRYFTNDLNDLFSFGTRLHIGTKIASGCYNGSVSAHDRSGKFCRAALVGIVDAITGAADESHKCLRRKKSRQGRPIWLLIILQAKNSLAYRGKKFRTTEGVQIVIPLVKILDNIGFTLRTSVYFIRM